MSEATIPDALAQRAELERAIVGRRLAIFLDYDGTLTPIADRPELAVLAADVRETIRALARRCTVAIVSGRDRSDVERLVGLEELVYAGSHGFDIAGPRGLHKQHEHAADFLAALDRAEALLRERLRGVEGALVERKRYALAAHYRLVAEPEVVTVATAVDAALVAAEGALRKTGGKKILELRPQLPWDKGRAVLWLLGALELAQADVLPIYMGDDETDEDAFRALAEHGGIGVRVGSDTQQTAAKYRVDDPAAAGRLLEVLLGAVQA